MENTVTIGEKDAGARGATAASGSGTGTRAQGRAGSRRRLGWVAIVPFFVVVALFEIMPLLQLAFNSVIGRDSEAFGLENYVRVFTTPLYQQSIWNSVWISLLSAVVGIVVRNAFTMILNMMSNFSGVPLAFAFMILMGNAGVLTLIGQRFGIPFLADFNLYGADGLVIMYIYFQIPLATLLLIPAFAGIRKSWREAATILQASTFDYWFKIVIPNLMPSILGTLSVLFSNALAAYATAYALVMNNYALLALQITSRFKGDVQTDAATGGALAVVLIALMVVCTLVNNYFTRRAAKGRELV